MTDFATKAITPAVHLFGGGQNECLPRIAALCAALAALAVLIAAPWHPVHADGGASSARNKPSASTPGDSGATMQAYAQRILRILSDRHANNWVRYWQARYDCDAAPDPATPLDRVLLALTAALCAQLEARLGVNPADYSPRGEERTVGLLLNEPVAAAGYTLFANRHDNDVFLLDPLGRVAYAWRLDKRFRLAKLLDNGNLLATVWSRRIFEFDPRGNIVWQYHIRGIHHDFIKMPNGNVLTLVRRFKTREQAIAAGANPALVHENGLEYDHLIEVRPSGATEGEIVWEWSTWDHIVQNFDPSKPNYGAIAEHPELIDINFRLSETMNMQRPRPRQDWLHLNAIDYNPELDQIMLSARHYSELWIIDHSATMAEARGHAGGNSDMGGDLLYRWGNPRAYGHGDARDQRLFWQHQTHWIPPGLPGAGNILLFNNGNEFPGYERFYSSIDEIAPPADGYRYLRAPNSPYPPRGLEWTYAAETPSDLYAPVVSGAQRLPNGNTLIVDGTAGTIFQVAPDGGIAWKYIVPLNGLARLRQGDTPSIWQTIPTPYGDPVHYFTNQVYRAYWYPPDHPGLQALDLTPGAYLEDLPDIYDKAYAAATAGDFGDPLARSDFDIYLDHDENQYKRRLIYAKRLCADEDTRAEFFLHITPVHARDLPAHRQEYGFHNRNFRFGDTGKAADGWCIAIAPLPDYPIERIRTGQLTGAGEAWQAEAELGEE